MSAKITPTLAICIAAAVVAVAALALPASKDSSGPAPAGDDTAAPAIEIVDFTYSGSESVETGATVDVTNADGAGHTLTAVDGSFDTGVLNGGESGTIAAPAAPGTYEYFCSIHPSMTGSLRVLE